MRFADVLSCHEVEAQDRSLGEKRRHMIRIHVVVVPIELKVVDVAQDLALAIGVDCFHRHCLAAQMHMRLIVLDAAGRLQHVVLFFTLNREDFSFVIHLDRQPRTSRRREAQTGSRARSGSRSERTLDPVEHSRTLMEWWPFLIFHRGGLRIKVINNTWKP